MKKDKYLPETIGIFTKSKNAAKHLQQKNVDMDIFTAIFLSNLSLGCRITFSNKNLLQDLLQRSFEKINDRKPKNVVNKIGFTPKVKDFLLECERMSFEDFGLDYVAPEVILLNLLNPDFATRIFQETFINEQGEYNELASNLIFKISGYLKDCPMDVLDLLGVGAEEKEEEINHNFLDMFADNPVLSQFAENLNLKASSGDFEKIIDFDNKIQELATILCRKKKPNAILVGPAGTGKTSIVEGLAASIVRSEAPELLSNKVIYSLSLSSMVAGTEFRGQFEKRLEQFIKEIKKYENVILFIDEVHTLVGAGGSSSNSLEASNILKPELARGTISCIGATTVNEYTNTIKKDSALDRRFERVTVREPSSFQMKQIVPQLIEYYEQFHNVKYGPSFIDNVLVYCEQFLPHKNYPDKAVDVIDHCGAQTKVKFWEMDEDMQVMKKAILDQDIHPDEQSHLLEEFEERFAKWVKDQDNEAPEVGLEELKTFFQTKENPLNKVSVVSNSFDLVRKNFVGNRKIINSFEEKLLFSNFKLNDSNSGVPIFCINGSKDSGKSSFSKVFKESLEQEGVTVFSYNGIHFSDDHAPWKISAYTRNNTSLAEKIIMEPNSVIIIDDFHKISKRAEPLFMEIFKEGRVRIDSGDVADFTNCKFFLTSDSVDSQKSMGFHGSKANNTSSVIEEHLTKHFVFNEFLEPLSKKDIRRILWKKIKILQNQMNLNNIKLSYNFKFLKQFVDKHFAADKVADFDNAFEAHIRTYVFRQMMANKSTIELKTC